ncbi:MAG: SGNH hydrolase domain-containing protein [Burkholderiaceae bacterium]
MARPAAYGTLAELGVKPSQNLFVVGPKLIGRFNIRELLARPAAHRIGISYPFSTETLEIEAQLRRALPEGVFVSMQAAVCGAGPECRLFTAEGDLISFDGAHLTPAGARLAGRRLSSAAPLAGLSLMSQEVV